MIAARKLFNMAVASNDAGDPFPIWGTCLGHQLLQILSSNVSRNDLLVETDSVGHPANLDFVADAARGSRLFGGMAPELRDKLASGEYNIALENHMYGVPPQHFERWPDLAEWYRVLSTTRDRNGLEYISTIEGVKYPFFGERERERGGGKRGAPPRDDDDDDDVRNAPRAGRSHTHTRPPARPPSHANERNNAGTQWHPEKPPFEFTMDEIPHTVDAIRVSQHLANVFIDTARKSSHAPRSREEDLELQIYDTCPIFAARFEVVAEDNYDGPDSYYCFDAKQRPPIGPDDAESDDGPPPSAASASRSAARSRRAVGEDGHEAHSRRVNAALGIKAGQEEQGRPAVA